ncbi:MAG: hypothetical protein HWE39_22330 [Oceanospirillaceae bacterium]|nr:hypothetical protein [Oceanospirillaceae bacterium]
MDDFPRYDGDFPRWEESFRRVESHIKSTTDGFFGEDKKDRYVANFPLRENILKLIVKEAYGRMPFNKEYVLKSYQRFHGGKPYLFYPARNAKKLIILVTGYVSYVSYNRFSWFFDEAEVWDRDIAYLFLCDPSRHWYVGKEGSDDLEIYSEIIYKTVESLEISKEDVYIVGASMGGYGALVLGCKTSLGGVISVHPQLSFKSTLRYGHRLWAKKISECGVNFIDIDDLFASSDIIPPIYLEVSRNSSDEFNLDNVIYELNKKNCVYTISRHASLVHETASPSRAKIEAVINFMELSKKLNSVDDVA